MATQLDSIFQPDSQLGLVRDQVLKNRVKMDFGFIQHFWAEKVGIWVYFAMISLLIHHFKSKHSKNLEMIRTDRKIEGVWVPWIPGRCPTRNIHVSGQWYAWKTNFYFSNFYLKKTVRFEGVFVTAASVSLTSVLSYRWPMFNDWENQQI